MQKFVIATIPTEGYQEIQNLGDGRYVAHLEPVEGEDGMTTCYECTTGTDNIEQLTSDLQAWKAKRQTRLTMRNNSDRMAEIQAELAATDYLALKAFEGEDMSEHEGWRERRAALREEYRQLEQANLALVNPTA